MSPRHRVTGLAAAFALGLLPLGAVRVLSPPQAQWRAPQAAQLHAKALVRPVQKKDQQKRSPFVSPHGGYDQNTTLCDSCHSVHVAPSATGLLSQDPARLVCYSCHDGTRASSNVREAFGEAVIGSSTKQSYHPVPAPLDGIRLQCSDCHNPHLSQTDSTALLQVKTGPDTYLTSPPGSPVGNAFCYGCHGPSSSYSAPYGNFSSFDQSIHNTSPNMPSPPSAAGIVCLDCHASHGSDYAALTTANQEQLCLGCHSHANPNTSGGSNPFDAFNAAANDYTTPGIHIYHHPVALADQAGGTRTVECVSCHNPHIASGTDTGTGSKIVNPADTTQPYIVNWTGPAGNVDRGSINDFCETCHVNPTQTQPVTAGSKVPYAINLVNDTSGGPDGQVHDKFTASDYNTVSSHGTTGNLACTACHDTHGSSNVYMLRENVVSPDGSSSSTMTGYTGAPADWQLLQTFCLTCHTIPTDHQTTDPTPTTTPAYQQCTECHYHGAAPTKF